MPGCGCCGCGNIKSSGGQNGSHFGGRRRDGLMSQMTGQRRRPRDPCVRKKGNLSLSGCECRSVHVVGFRPRQVTTRVEQRARTTIWAHLRSGGKQTVAVQI